MVLRVKLTPRKADLAHPGLDPPSHALTRRLRMTRQSFDVAALPSPPLPLLPRLSHSRGSSYAAAVEVAHRRSAKADWL